MLPPRLTRIRSAIQRAALDAEALRRQALKLTTLDGAVKAKMLDEALNKLTMADAALEKNPPLAMKLLQHALGLVMEVQ